MSEFTNLKRKFEALNINDDESPSINKKAVIQDNELYLLGKRIQSIKLVQPLQYILKKPDVLQSCLAFVQKESRTFSPLRYIDRPLRKSEEQE